MMLQEEDQFYLANQELNVEEEIYHEYGDMYDPMVEKPDTYKNDASYQ